MADILLRLDDNKNGPTKLYEEMDRIWEGPKGGCWIYGRKGTFCIVRDGRDAIASIGYVCQIDGGSVQETLANVLKSFHETQIGELKKKLVGEYVLLVKKSDSIYIFSDFMGVRNIFYSDDGMVVSSSFAQLEDLIQTSSGDLDRYKVLEYVAMRHMIYPAWLGRRTYHKNINWLLPYDYLAIDLRKYSLGVGSVVYSIDNKKQSDLSLLSSKLLSTLKAIVGRPEFKDSTVAASLTGGHDTRLVSAIAAEQYRNIRYRIAISTESPDSLKDLKVASKVARIQGVQLDVYQFQNGRDEERFYELTEGFSPSYNQTVTPLIDCAGSYSLGLGGVFGTELFTEIPWNSIDDYVRARISVAQKVLKVEDGFWKLFRESLYGEFRRTKNHFQLSNGDDRDYIRIFTLIGTARYSSFLLSAFNREGYQLDPYGTYAVFELALRVAPKLWGNVRRLRGRGWVQKTAMAKLDWRTGRVITYSHFRPMLPLSVTTSHLYMIGYTLQVGHWFKGRLVGINKKPVRAVFQGGYYISNGWEKQFLKRTMKKYGFLVNSSVS